jgi:predicted acylesterase/phospholipase RssA/ABC-type phosphate/phosphonate transport system substrate-binding protein
MRLTVLLSMTFPLAMSAAYGADSAEAPIEVRAAVVAFEDFHEQWGRWEQLFAELSGQSNPPLHFRLAAGTYGDVLHWIRQGSVDLAVMTPGVFAETLPGAGQGSPKGPCQYLATVGLPAATSAWAAADRRLPGYHFRCRSVCVVSAASTLKTADDLRREAKRDGLEFVFVHPLSLSGRIAAEVALRQLGIEPTREQVGYTYSHSGSLRLLAEPAGNRQRVAFVWDDALHGVPELAGQLRVLPFPQLGALEIPQSVVVVRAGCEHAELFRSLLAGHVDADANHDFACFDDWSTRYGVVRRWNQQLGLATLLEETQTVSLDEIGRILVHHGRCQPKPPRLALVLSGGGAKCAFQVGAVKALEEKLAELRREHPHSGLDIALVVGTSGGAINALPVALGITATGPSLRQVMERAPSNGWADLQQVWSELDQREIIRPSRLVRANIGLWSALFQLACLLALVRRGVWRVERRGWVFASLVVLLAAVEITLGYVHRSPWRLLGENHVWHHAWLWITFGIRASAWTLLVLGLVGLAAQGLLVRRQKHLTAPTWLKWVLATGLLGLPLIQIITVLFYEKTLSGGSGIENALAEKFPRLINRQLARGGEPPLELASGWDARQRLEAASRHIIRRGLLRRDLVLTGSCLEQSGDLLPDDLYFYAAANPKAQPPAFGPRGISLVERPSLLLDVVMGSGAIFPLFPPRRLHDLPRPGEYVELVDGGFAHNSPIEAAVLWGATHIVLIKASPEERPERRNFLGNAAAAYKHLYQQSQLVDTRSRGEVVIFTLAPEPPHLCVLDFADNLIEAAVAKGYREARGQSAGGDPQVGGLPRFHKEPGEPLFVDLPSDRP